MTPSHSVPTRREPPQAENSVRGGVCASVAHGNSVVNFSRASWHEDALSTSAWQHCKFAGAHSVGVNRDEV
eukprot:CAMPEP_0194553156 /NCGR_PEP_ID=MMETSP0253-20130528/97090_1 /TAXON_ID=2966 /ORGANISM="Noctiluca scintillans" /LENGTH=70 /DNA_ID=CAMNT_0039400631 /DNA_START=949 /DNA_END=1161 /DNA_ORIENTATION=-